MAEQKPDTTVKEIDPLYVDKQEPSMEDVEVQGGLHVASGEDSRVNDLDSISYEDHQQVFGAPVLSGKQPEDAASGEAAGSAANVDDPDHNGL